MATFWVTSTPHKAAILVQQKVCVFYVYIYICMILYDMSHSTYTLMFYQLYPYYIYHFQKNGHTP